MRRSSIWVAVAFAAGLAVGFFAKNTRDVLERRQHAADLAGIEKLHREDAEATLTQNPQALLDIWTDDAVRFNPGGPPTVGKQAIQAENAIAHASGLKVLSYAAKYKNAEIEGGMACEWGEHEAQFKLSSDAPPVSWHGGGFHVLRRRSDGAWKFAVLIGDQ